MGEMVAGVASRAQSLQVPMQAAADEVKNRRLPGRRAMKWQTDALIWSAIYKPGGLCKAD